MRGVGEDVHRMHKEAGMSAMPRRTQGVVLIHSASKAMCRHIEWAIGSILGAEPTIDWTPQPALRDHVRCELSWTGGPGTGAAISSALRGWEGLRYEVTEDPSPGYDGSRWQYTPSLGLAHFPTSANGDLYLTENRLRDLLDIAMGSPDAVFDMLGELLGDDYDAELEPFRYAGDGAPVRWLHKVG